MEKRKYGFINTSGQYVVEPIFHTVYDFEKGLAAVQLEEEGKWGYLDRNGCVVVEPQYDEVGNFSSDGLAWVRSRSEYYYINSTGRRIIGPLPTDTFTEVYSFNEGLAGIRQGSKFGYINQNSQIVIEPTFDFKTIGSFRNGLAKVENKQSKWGLINKTGQFVLAPIYDSTENDFHEDILRVAIKDKIGFVNKNGETIIEPRFDGGCTDFFQEGLAAVKYGNKWGYIDKTGKFVIETRYEKTRRFQEGIAAVKDGTKWGYIDKNERIVIKPQFDYAGDFLEGYAYIKNEDKYGVIDKSGQILFEPQYIADFWIRGNDKFNDGLAPAHNIKNYDKRGYIDKTRKLVIDPIFDEAYEFHDGLAMVGMDIDADTNTFIAFKKLPRCSQPQSNTQSSSQTQSSRGPQTRHHGNQKSGCYIATAVYGSYDCPEVWTLRRYRDQILDKSWYGKAFIRFYYAFSPILVRWFGRTQWFRLLLLKPLNRWVERLNKCGVENTLYYDKK